MHTQILIILNGMQQYMFFKLMLTFPVFLLLSINLAVAVEDTKKDAEYYKAMMINKKKSYFEFIEKNEKIIAEISIMGANDQYIRSFKSTVSSKLENNAKEFKKFVEYNMNQMKDVDKTNQIRLKQILNSFTWRDFTEIGDHVTISAFHIIQHADLEFRLEYIKDIQILVGEHKMSGFSFAAMFDRIAVEQDRKQTYGTQFNCVDGLHQIAPIIDPQNVDKRRKEMGLLLTMAEQTELLLKMGQKSCSE